MARTVLHRTPVVIYVPELQASIGLHRGVELPDDHPICQDPVHAYLFEDSPEPDEVESVTVEQATAAPGERRFVTRPKRQPRA